MIKFFCGLSGVCSGLNYLPIHYKMAHSMIESIFNLNESGMWALSCVFAVVFSVAMGITIYEGTKSFFSK